MSSKIIFELCAETIAACISACDGGADRIELCSALSEDGLTPSHGFIRAAVALSNLPVHVLIRPRSGNFVYSNEEFKLMRDDILHARELGAAGVVIGLLNSDATVDVARTHELVELASPLEVTFHRAFDSTLVLEAALEDVISTGSHRLLTSGGQPDVLQGATSLRRLNEIAAGRIAIAAGGGLRLENARDVVLKAGVQQVHGSLRRKILSDRTSVLSSGAAFYIVDPEDIRSLKQSLSDI
ncbi:MAG TPA: copper homeostasis protein CutC [Edaphobacter sp.]